MVLNRRIRRVLRENLAQYSGSIVLILLSCFIFTGMTLVGANVQRLSDEFSEQYVQEHASFIAAESIADIPAIEAAGDAQVEEGQSFDTALAPQITLRVMRQNERINLPAIVEGEGLSAGGQILLNAVFARSHDYQVGDVLTILDRPFTIAGYMALPHYIYPLQAQTDLMYSQQSFGIAVISREDFAALGQGVSSYAVRYNQIEPNPRDQAARFREILESKGVQVVQWTDIADNNRVSSVTLKLSALNTMSRVMPLALLLLTSVLVCTVIARLIARETTIIGALYALGYTRREIAGHYLVFPAAIAVIGAILGSLLGLLVVRPMIAFYLSYFEIPLTGVRYSPAVILTGILLPVVFLCLSSFLVIWRQLRRSPVELMKGDRDQARVNFLERALKLERFKFAAKFKIRAQLRSLPRLVFLLAGCAAATMLMLYGFAVRSSLDYFSKESLTDTFHFEYEYIFKSLQFEPPPAGVEPFSPALFLAAGDDPQDFFVSGILPDSALLSLVDRSGRPLSSDQVIMTRPLAKRLNVKAGDTVNLVRKLDERAFSITIDSIADTYVGKYIFMPLDRYNQTFDLPEGSYLGLWSPHALDIPQEQLYSHKSIDESLAAIQEITAPVRTLIIGYSIGAFVIGLIVIFLVTSMIVEENRRTISLLKIFGYPKRTVNALVLNSSTFVVVLGYLLGIPLILSSIGALLQNLDDSTGLTMPVRMNPLYLLICFIVVMAVFELSKLLCRKRVESVSMSEALKLETE